MATDPSNGPKISLTSLSLILLSAVLWGSTDACMKYLSPPSISNKSGLLSFFLSLLSTPCYLLCLATNQLGSVVYYYSLATAPLSVVSPAVNTGKVLVTVFVGRVLGEQQVSAKKWLGLLLLLSGVVLQITA